MIYSIFPTADATLYEYYNSSNDGMGETLDIGKYTIGSTNYNNRALIKFKTSDIQDVLSQAGKGVADCKFYLNLYCTQEESNGPEYTVEGYIVSSSWVSGTGVIDFVPKKTKGVSWNWIDKKYGTQWTTSSLSTGSVGGLGGVWYTGSAVSQSFSYYDHPHRSDIRMDITDIVSFWVSNSNDGMIIKKSAIDEASEDPYEKLSYFSKETNTIFSPRLEICWDDAINNPSSSLQLLDTSAPYIIWTTLGNETFNENSKIRININARPKYPPKTFVTASTNYIGYRIPYSSSYDTYYSVVDVKTGESIIPFSDYTKISRDLTSNYFYLWTGCLFPERYYKFVFKVETATTTNYFDNRYMFKVVR